MLACRTMVPRRSKSRGESASFARRVPSREGSGTLRGFPRGLSPVLCLAAAAAVGCGSSGLKVTKISVAADQPSNVAVYVDVKDKLGRPIPGLAEKNFRVYEDGKLVTTSKA